MAKNKPSKTALAGLKCLRQAVRKEFAKKALLSQYVIINRNGKPWRVSARKALEMAKSKQA